VTTTDKHETQQVARDAIFKTICSDCNIWSFKSLVHWY